MGLEIGKIKAIQGETTVRMRKVGLKGSREALETPESVTRGCVNSLG